MTDARTFRPPSLTPPRVLQLELLDAPSTVAADIPANLADIRRLNRWFGGTSLALRYIRRLVHSYGAHSVLDVATGSADIPVAVARWSRTARIDLQIDAVDLYPEVLDQASKQVAGTSIRLHRADARSLPWPDNSVDVVVSCLALHHFDPPEARQVLGEMWRVAQYAVLVTDLERSYPGYAGAWLASHTIAPNRLTRNDAPLSVLRSYTPEEMRRLAREAGLHRTVVKRHAFFRQALIASKGSAHAN